VKAVPGRNGLDGWNAPMDGTHLTPAGQRTAHFGVRDGIANPLIQGFHSEKPKRKWHAPGELLLGYANDLDFNPWLLVDPWEQDSPWLLPRASIKPELFRNGSFAAFRKISQDEKAFRAFLAQCAIDMGETAEYWKAKMTGRWSDGQVVKPGEQAAPSAPPPDLDEFDFSDDPKAEGCPFGSHIRRMNPRKDRVVPFRRRPLMRRGMPYGPLFDKDPGKERGLLGLFFCASLEDQFEHLIAEWGNSNPMGPPNRGRAKDPIMGNHEDPGAQLEVPVPGSKLYEVDGFTPFVTTRGTLYAFYPGLAALAMIGKGQA
jgi:deferrochelatase/peroxidase EfeB